MPELCGATTRSGEPCKKPAGHGTPYETGRCSNHGGATPNHQRKAQRELAEAAMSKYGEPADGVDPILALWGELRRTAGHVAWLGALLEAGELQAEQDADGVRKVVRLTQDTFGGGQAPSVWMELYHRERRHLLDVSKTAIAAGLEERRVRLEESHGDWIADFTRRLIEGLGLELADERVQRAVQAAFAGSAS